MKLFASGRRKRRTFVVSMGLLLCCLPAFSQLNLGRIYGAVADQSGAFVPGATVTVTDVARGVSRTLTTDQAGEYAAPSLLPGTYRHSRRGDRIQRRCAARRRRGRGPGRPY